MQNINWIDYVTNEAVSQRVQEWNILQTKKKESWLDWAHLV
jgi:hypothetical protein